MNKLINKIMQIRPSVLIATSLVFSPLANAVGVCKDCTVTGIQPDPRRGGTYIFLDGDWADSATNCTSTISVKAFFVKEGSPLEPTLISTALFGLATGNTVGYAYGNGTCTPSNYEEIDYLYIKSSRG